MVSEGEDRCGAGLHRILTNAPEQRILWERQAVKGSKPGRTVNCDAVSRVLANYVNSDRPDDPVDELRYSDRVRLALYGKDGRRYVSYDTLSLFIKAFQMTDEQESWLRALHRGEADGGNRK